MSIGLFTLIILYSLVFPLIYYYYSDFLPYITIFARIPKFFPILPFFLQFSSYLSHSFIQLPPKRLILTIWYYLTILPLLLNFVLVTLFSFQFYNQTLLFPFYQTHLELLLYSTERTQVTIFGKLYNFGIYLVRLTQVPLSPFYSYIVPIARGPPSPPETIIEYLTKRQINFHQSD